DREADDTADRRRRADEQRATRRRIAQVVGVFDELAAAAESGGQHRRDQRHRDRSEVHRPRDSGWRRTYVIFSTLQMSSTVRGTALAPRPVSRSSSAFLMRSSRSFHVFDWDSQLKISALMKSRGRLSGFFVRLSRKLRSTSRSSALSALTRLDS